MSIEIHIRVRDSDWDLEHELAESIAERIKGIIPDNVNISTLVIPVEDPEHEMPPLIKEKGVSITTPIKIFDMTSGAYLEELRKEIIAKFEGKNVSLNQLLLEYGSNKLVDVSVGEPDSPFDYGRWKVQLETFKKAGVSDIVLINVSEGGYGDVISLQTSTIRLIVSEPTTKLMKDIENLRPDSIDYQKEYIELFFD